MAFTITAPVWLMLSLTLVGSGIYHPWRQRIDPEKDRPALRRPGTWVIAAIAFVLLFAVVRGRLNRYQPTPQ